MPDDQYCVFVVVNPEFGARLSELVRMGPVWVLDTQMNRQAADSIWSEGRHHNHLDGITVFKSNKGGCPEECFLCVLDTIDLHHGVYSADPPYTVLEVVGTPSTERIRNELSQFGFTEFQSTSEGLRAIRPLPKNC